MTCKQPNQWVQVSGLRSSTKLNQATKRSNWMFAFMLIAPVAYFVLEPGGGNAQILPPPPSVISVPGLDVKSNSLTTSPTPPAEMLFQAPVSPSGTNISRYIVYVNGDSPYLLQEVRAAEPGAFMQQVQGRRVIQVGTFSNEANARQQIATLNTRGIMAEMTSTNSSPNFTQTSRYLVVIPGRRSELSSLRDQAIQLGVRQDAIQEKDAPLGPHLEIGPFAEHGEARDLDRALRRSGLDSRVYYSR